MKFKKFIVSILVLVAIILLGNSIIKYKFFPYRHQEYVDKYAKAYDLDPLFILSVIKTESKFNSEAESHKNAIGLMQITKSTGKWLAEEMGIEDYTDSMLYDEEINIMLGCWYLRRLKNEYGTWNEALAAYNAGSGNVTKWLSDEEYSKDGKTLYYIPFGETKKYVDKVNTYYKIYKYYYKNSFNDK